jgi:adenine/guanine phosphoribosyltransferase-like PRPP-binding protein
MKENMEEIQSKSEVSKERYNFPEIEHLRPGLLNICQKMKADIETNKWDILVSDETGGRIPTLVIWNLIKKFHPANPPKPFFISSGLSYRPTTAEESFDEYEYYKKITSGAKSVLLVTQYIRTGETIKGMVGSLEMADIKKENIDVAAVVTIDDDKNLERVLGHEEGKIFAGTSEARISDSVVEGFYPRFTGVSQDKTKYSPAPIKLTENIQKTGKRGFLMKEEDYRKIFNLEDYAGSSGIYEKVIDKKKRDAYKQKDKKPLSPEEERELQENIKKAREDVNTLVRELLRDVWNMNDE